MLGGYSNRMRNDINGQVPASATAACQACHTVAGGPDAAIKKNINRHSNAPLARPRATRRSSPRASACSATTRTA